MAKKILIVEDDEGIRENLQALLELEDFRVNAVENGRAALEYLRNTEELPSLIILDLMMPVMDGYQFREKQMDDPKISSIPVIIMTADTQAQSKTKNLKVLSLLKKPLELDQLLESIKRVP